MFCCRRTGRPFSLQLLPLPPALSYRAADESFTICLISPWLKLNPMWLALSFCIVMVRSKGRSRTANTILSAGAFFTTFEALSDVKPAIISPLICGKGVTLGINGDDDTHINPHTHMTQYHALMQTTHATCQHTVT